MVFFIPHFFVVPLLLYVFPQTNCNVEIGSSLLAGDTSPSGLPWRSLSNDFAFGFQQFHSDDLFLLAIWFYQIPDSTTVWFAKQKNNDPILATSGSKLELTASNGLVLLNTKGEQIWNSEIKIGTVAFAIMNDSGNFQLLDSNKRPVWESFRFPTDTLLPSQVMVLNDVISSRKSQNSFRQGRFQFRLLQDGNAVLNSMNLPTNYPYDAYYISNTKDDILFNSGYNVVFDQTGFLYVLKRNGERVNLTLPSKSFTTMAFYYRATLHFDGVFTVSSYPKKNNPRAVNGGWKDIATIPDNICLAVRGVLGTGACGYNSICKLKPDLRPSCKCPPGYSLVDPNDEYGSCKPNSIQSCEEEGAGNEIYSLVDLQNTDWPMLDYELFSPFSLEDCKRVCLNDCFCVVSVYRDNTCWKKKLPLCNGRQDPLETSISFLKLKKQKV